MPIIYIAVAGGVAVVIIIVIVVSVVIIRRRKAHTVKLGRVFSLTMKPILLYDIIYYVK